jgi:hypothetical protein
MYIIEKGLSYQRLILVVQEKLDCPVSETGLSSFHGFKPPGQNLPLHHFSHFSLLHTQEQPWGWPQDPHWWFLGSSLESWSSWVKSTPQEPVSPFPQLIFPHLKVFSPNPRSLCLMDGFEIPLVHYLHSCHRSIPYNISKFSWLNWSDSLPRVEFVEIRLSDLQNWTVWFWQTCPSLWSLVFYCCNRDIMYLILTSCLKIALNRL